MYIVSFAHTRATSRTHTHTHDTLFHSHCMYDSSTIEKKCARERERAGRERERERKKEKEKARKREKKDAEVYPVALLDVGRLRDSPEPHVLQIRKTRMEKRKRRREEERTIQKDKTE